MRDLLEILAGVGMLYVGGEALVKSSTGLARTLGMAPLVIGLTVVAFGTSSPELAASLMATLRNQPQIAVGNVLGSNIANLGLILGIAALLFPLQAQARFILREVPFMILLSALVLVFAGGGGFSRGEAAVLLALLGLFLVVLLRSRSPDREPVIDLVGPTLPVWKGLLGVLVGVLFLSFGADVLLRGAVGVAQALGVSDRVIGLTLVALGTSLPELATCSVAALRRQGDLVLGGLVGSNVFNIGLILSVCVLVRPLPVRLAASAVDLWVMMGLALLVLPLIALGRAVSRLEGAVLLIVYLGYVVYLFR